MRELLQSGYQDIPRYYTALAEWLGCMLFCFLYGRKLQKKHFVILAAAALVVQILWLILTEGAPTFLWIPCMVIAAGIMYLFLLTVINVSRAMVLYCCMKAFLIAEFMASLE